MTSKTKYILFGIIGVGVLAVGAVVFVAVLAIGMAVMSAEPGQAKGNDKNTSSKNKLYKQADVDGLIKFHEWVAETKFTSAQRDKFESFVEKDFERDAADARKKTDELLETFKQIKAADKGVQSTTRTLLVPAYIADFRKKNDDYSRFMLSIYDKENSGNGTDDTNNSSSEETDSPQGSISQEITGRWHRDEGSSYIDATGKTQYGAGADFTYHFSSDGTVEYTMDKKVKTIMQCDMVEKKSRNGKYAVNGDTITVNFGEMKFFSSSSCDDKDNFDKTLPAETVTLKWSLKTEYEVTRLTLQDENGEFSYDKKDD